MATNPRYASRARLKLDAAVRAMGLPCGICRGLRGPIHYDEPRDAAHPLSYVLDEIHPIKYWREYGYDSPTAAATDPGNVQPAHRICNAEKGCKDGWHLPAPPRPSKIVTSRSR